jgi:CRISPR-associated protein Cmr4
LAPGKKKRIREDIMAKHSIMFINLLEPLHNGAGEGLGDIDQPIIRETPTSFPIIQPSSLKGALRHRFTELWRDPPEKYKVLALFGPEAGEGAERYGGAISCGEGQLLAFPVRSLKGLFVWATSPRILFRFQQRIQIAGIKGLGLDELLKKVPEWRDFWEVRICPEAETSLLIGDPPKLVLEEFSYLVQQSQELANFAKQLSDTIYDKDSYWADEFRRKLVVLPEDSFRYFVTIATEVTPNIRIGETGTTEEGSLRYTEYLPRESVLYNLITYDRAKMPERWESNEEAMKKQFDYLSDDKDGDERVRELFETNKPKMLQLGGDETTGKGLVQLKILKGGQKNDKKL